jgi:peptidoglycan/xylan/chitin deacetylase (PgdA/CDA1 family)
MMLFYLIGIPAICYVLYCIVPTYYYKWFKSPVMRVPAGGKNILLTFDDGPDPRYTDKLLKLLEENGVHATFFVVAKKAALNGNIIRRMLKEGHVVALHSLEHKSVWIKGWRYIKRDFIKSMIIMKELGCKPEYYRPPYGHINLMSLFLAKEHGMKIMLWDVIVQDWKKSSSAQLILGRMLQHTKNNSVICLHDSGEGIDAAVNAPEHTIKALQIFLPVMIEEGYHFILPGEDMK